MASENETVAEIVSEMRGEWAQVYFSEGSRRKDGEYCDNEFAAIESGTVADRIEAAHGREVAELRECLKEAIEWSCGNPGDACEDCVAHGGDTPCKCEKWRKAQEGVSK